jgi:hypothetical protein
MIYRSRYPEPYIPDRELSAFVLASALEHPDRATVIDAPSGRRLSYGKLSARVDAFAGGLAHLGPRRFLVLHDHTYPGGVADAVLAHLAERVAPYKRVRRYDLSEVSRPGARTRGRPRRSVTGHERRDRRALRRRSPPEQCAHPPLRRRCRRTQPGGRRAERCRPRRGEQPLVEELAEILR